MILKTSVPSEEDYRSFVRPAVLDSLRQMLKFYGLESTAQIYYNGHDEVAKLIGANATDKYRSDIFTDGVMRNKLFVVAEFEPHEFNSGNANQRREMTERAVWMDTQEKPMIIYPGFTGSVVRVGVIAGFNSDKLAKQFVRRINYQQSQQITDMNFSATVHLGLNPAIVELIHHIHGLWKKNDPTTPELGEWFSARCRAPFTTISNAAGKHQRLVTPMKLSNIGIMFAEPTVAQSRKADIMGKWEVQLNYSFFFPEFTHWELEYPLNVYQDEIDQKWIPRPQKQHTDRFEVKVAPEMAFIQPFTEVRDQQAPYFLRLPEHDPWAMRKQAWVQPIIQARLKLQDVESQVLCNIFEIPGFKWNEQIKRYMLRRHKTITYQFFSPFLVQVFSDDMAVSPEQIVMDENGVVTLTRPPTMQNTYRIVITLDYAIRDYLPSFWEDLEAHPEDWALMPAIFVWYRWDKLPRPWGHHVYQILKEIDKGRGLPGWNFNNYMMELGLQAHRLNILEKV